jgi:hypothetical protein
MESAILWHELAASGQLARPPGYPALEASVLDTGRDEDRPALPGGLSAVLRDQPPSASGVPIRSAMMSAMAADGSNSWRDGELPGAAVPPGPGVVQDPVRPDRPAAPGIAAVQSARSAHHGLASWPSVAAAHAKEASGVLDQGSSSKILDVIQHAAAERIAPEPWIPEPAVPNPEASKLGATVSGVPKLEAVKLRMLEPGAPEPRTPGSEVPGLGVAGSEVPEPRLPKRRAPDPVAAVLLAAASTPAINDTALAAVSKNAVAAGDSGRLSAEDGEAVPVGQATVSERLAATAQLAASGRPWPSDQSGELDTARTAALPEFFGGLQDRSGSLLSPVSAAARSGPDAVPAGNAAVGAAASASPVDRPAAGPPAGLQTAFNRILADDIGMTGGSGLGNLSLGGPDVVPRRTGRSMPANATTRPQDIVGSAQAGAAASGRFDAPGSPAATAGGNASGRDAARVAQPNAMVALRGDVVLDGRKMGHIVAVGQTSAASLPTVSASAINLRALPVFAGTGAPL